MLVALLLLLIAIPVAEIWVIVQVAHHIGILETLVLLLAVSGTGAWLLKQQGLATWRRLQDTMQRGEMPTQEAADGALILLGGALLLTPGFITDAVGLILILPPTRGGLKGLVRRGLHRWARRRVSIVTSASGVYSTTAVRRSRATREDGPTSRPLSSPPLPHAGSPSTEDGSPDKG
jgi:UPF0716 protein FxsA